MVWSDGLVFALVLVMHCALGAKMNRCHCQRLSWQKEPCWDPPVTTGTHYPRRLFDRGCQGGPFASLRDEAGVVLEGRNIGLKGRLRFTFWAVGGEGSKAFPFSQSSCASEEQLSWHHRVIRIFSLCDGTMWTWHDRSV